MLVAAGRSSLRNNVAKSRIASLALLFHPAVGRRYATATPKSFLPKNRWSSPLVLSTFAVGISSLAVAMHFGNSVVEAKSGKPDAGKNPHGDMKITPMEMIIRADELYENGNLELLYSELFGYVEQIDANQPAILWRYARACHDVAQIIKTPETKKKLIYKAYEVAKKALELNDKDYACHKWMGITLSAIGEYEGTKNKIQNAFQIRDHFVAATKINPADATSWHLIGLWCFTFSEMPWYMHKIAATLFATPPTSTFEEALNYFLKAEEIDPRFYKKNALMIAKCYQHLKDVKQAKEWVEVALSIPTITEDDKQAHLEAEKLVKSL